MAGQGIKISWLLCLLLVFPLAGQSLHVLIHHHHQEHHPDSSRLSKLVPQPETCLVCEYEFTSFTFSLDRNHPDTCTVVDGYGHALIPMACCHFTGADISLRAPPVCG